jgi:hypothetical protein
MEASFDDIVKDYMLSYVSNVEYSVDDYRNGSRFINNTFSRIKGGEFNSNEDLQYLSKKYLVEKIGLTESKLNVLRKKLY